MSRLLWAVLAIVLVPHAALAVRVDPPVRPVPSAHRALDLLVKFKPGADHEAVHRRVAAALGAQPRARGGKALLRRPAGALRAAGLDRLELTPGPASGRIAEALAAYRRDPDVEYAEEDSLLTVLDTAPNDPKYSGLWGVKRIAAPRAWDVTQGDSAVIVAIVDTGIDLTHPDLAGNLWVNAGEVPGNQIDDDDNGYVDDVHGYDFANEDGDPTDDFGHGTHVAGTVGAVGDNHRHPSTPRRETRRRAPSTSRCRGPRAQKTSSPPTASSKVARITSRSP